MKGRQLKNFEFIRSSVLATLFAIGCSRGPAKLVIHPVEGQVLVNDKPRAGVLVTLHPADPVAVHQLRPGGFTTADGSFTVNSYLAGDGAPEGEYAVTVALYVEQMVRGEADPTLGPNQFPARYNDPAATPFKVRVQKGPNKFAPFRVNR